MIWQILWYGVGAYGAWLVARLIVLILSDG